MFCARYHQALPASSFAFNPLTEQKERLRGKQVFFLSSSPSSLGKHQWQISNYPKLGFRLKPKVSSMLPPSESGDITTFLFVSGAMISMYLVSNFLVPSMLFKSLQDDDEEEEEDSN